MVLIDTKFIKMLVYRLQNTAFGSASIQAAHLPLSLLISAPYPGQISDESNAGRPRATLHLSEDVNLTPGF